MSEFLLRSESSLKKISEIKLKNSEESEFQANLESWSIFLSTILNLPLVEVRANLCQLYKAYQTQNIEGCFTAINQFQNFPGYPFFINNSFTQHINYVCTFLNKATTTNLPKVPVFAYPKTASSFISVVLCQQFEILPTVFSLFHFKGVQAWVSGFRKWGGVVHEHYYPTSDNINLLTNNDITRCIVHTRHPVEILISRAYHNLKNYNCSANPIEQEKLIHEYINKKMDTLFNDLYQWKNSWKQQALSKRIRILETNYDEMKFDKKSFFKRIFNFCEVDCDAFKLECTLRELELAKNKKVNNFNFRKSLTNEWKEVLTADQVKKAKKIINMQFPEVSF